MWITADKQKKGGKELATLSAQDNQKLPYEEQSWPFLLVLSY
jgi:hypothetical protein